VAPWASISPGGIRGCRGTPGAVPRPQWWCDRPRSEWPRTCRQGNRKVARAGASDEPGHAMRISALVSLVLFGAAGGAAHPDAEVREGVVYVGRVPRWPERGAGQDITTPLVWSRRGDAVAFAARDVRGSARLVVLLVQLDGSVTPLEWAIPRAAQPARAVTWLGPTRVGTGPSALEPRATASWVTR